MIVLVGASASGKTEVARALKNKYGLTKIITHTTRAMREKEIDGVDYHIVSVEDFLNLKKDNYFVETTEYNGNYYGTSRKEIEDNKVLVVDPNGLHAFVALGDHRIVTFFLNAAESTREKRMLLRGDHPEAIQKRLENDKADFSYNNVGRTDFVIDTEKISVEEVADSIYKLYIGRLATIVN